jgi:hypothetical protein
MHISSEVLVESPKPFEAMCFNLRISFIGSIRTTWMDMPQMLPEVHRMGSFECIILLYIIVYQIDNSDTNPGVL